MSDSYGDGWNGAYLEVTSNGVHSGDFDCDQSFTLDSVFSFNGAAMNFIFHSGNWDSEITFAIVDPLGDTLFYGPAPNDLDNLLHTSNSTCPAASCVNPSALNASNITLNSADLDWVPFGNDSAWNLNWGVSGFVQGTSNLVSNLINPNYSISGLNSNTSYDFYVQSICDSSSLSIWSGPFTFTTNLSTGTCGTFSIELSDSYGDGWNGGYLEIEVNGTIVQNITLLNGAGPETTFFAVDSSDVVNLLYGAGAWPEENSYAVYDHLGNLIVNQTSLPQHNGPPSTYGLEACPNCAAPQVLSAGNITTTLADLSWVAGGSGGSSWNLEWGTNSFVLGSGNLVNNLSIANYVLSGLNDNTSYDFYVQEICSSNDTSIWSGPYTFTTIALPPVPGTCGMFSILMYDSFGDGWNGGSLDIQINGSITQNITLSSGNGPETINFPVDSGDIVDIIYNEGNWADENSYEVFDNNNLLIASEDGATSPTGAPGNSYGLIACQQSGSSNCGIFTVQLYDVYGNGWNDGYLSIELDTVLIDTITLITGFGGPSTVMSFGIDSGQVLDLIYHPPVPHSQNSYLDGYKLLDDLGNIVVEEIGLDSTGPSSSHGIILCPSTTSINQSIIKELVIFPNPANEFININSIEPIDHIIITNVLGEVVYESSNDKNNIDISIFPSNIYFLRLVINGKITTKKIIIKH